jgi:hypothetical protein
MARGWTDGKKIALLQIAEGPSFFDFPQSGKSPYGGHSWDRTNDLPIKSRLLYQLSYVPEIHEKNKGYG